MRFSIFTTLPPVGRSPDQVLKDFREQVALAEELGFHAVWIGEHHFQPFGGGDLPNAILIGADIAARTSSNRSGRAVAISTSGPRRIHGMTPWPSQNSTGIRSQRSPPGGCSAKSAT